MGIAAKHLTAVTKLQRVDHSASGAGAPRLAAAPTPWSALVAAGVAVSWLAIGADAWARHGWGAFAASDHLLGALAVQSLVGAALGLACVLVVAVLRQLTRWARWVGARAAALVAPVLCGAGAGWLTFRTGARLLASASTPLPVPGTDAGVHGGLGAAMVWLWVAVCTTGAVAAAATWWVQRACRLLEQGRPKPVLLTALASAMVGSALAYADLTVYVALYQRVHELLELVAAGLLTLAAALGLSVAAGRGPSQRRWMQALALLALVWSGLFVASEAVRRHATEALMHTRLEPVYLGRSLARLQLAEEFLRDPLHWKGAGAARLARVCERYDIASVSLGPIWTAPSPTPALARATSNGEGKAARPYNLVVFYVDTLRYDAAVDPAIMPHVSRFSRNSLHFRRTYASASDTVSVLPVMMSGSYVAQQAEDDLLTFARRAGVKTTVAIARSAERFLAKHLPAFRFDETMVVQDYEPGTKVWGYGADQPSAPRIVDEALRWLGQNRDERFLLWLFHYDVHNWRELDRDYVYRAAERLELPDAAPLNWRYRVAAATVDAELGRFLDGLEQLGLADRTVVVVVADHGEALGRHGFWVHAVFLWESLVHVPLMVRVPGVSPRIVDEPVGIVDLYATLAPLLAPEVSSSSRHGVDLLRYVGTSKPTRRFPLLMQASRKDTLLRVGVIDRDEALKLVLPLESATAELYDLTASEPDDAEVSRFRRRDTLRLLNELVQSPYFPRPKEEPSKQTERVAALE